MTDFISREAAIKAIQDYGKGAISAGMTALDPVCDIFSLARAMEWLDAADVAPVVQGEWLFGDIEPTGCAVRCSVCGWGVDHADPILWLEYAGHKYCGNCGAKMDGGPHADDHD